MAASDARVLPRKNVAYRVTFSLVDADGDLVVSAIGLDSEVSKDGAAFIDCLNEASELPSASGLYGLDLTASEMNADTVVVLVKSASGARTTPLVLYPEESGDVRVDGTTVADAFLKRDWASVTGVASRSTLNALRVLRNKWTMTVLSLLVTTEDDATPAWTSALTKTGLATRTVGIVPTLTPPALSATTMPESTIWTPVMPTSSQGAAAFEPKLILLTQSQLPDATGATVFVYPSYIATKVAHIETLPFDGIAFHWPLTYSLMNGSLHSVASIAAHWAPLDGAAWSRMQHNFALVGVDKPADFFDDWSNTIQSFANLATVAQDLGFAGIMFDNEDYANELWQYPDECRVTPARIHSSSITTRHGCAAARSWRRFARPSRRCA